MNSSPHQHRFAPIDATRGLLMVLMALDHTAYFIAKIGPHEVFSLPLPDYPNAAAFLTRYVTHLVAPGFSFFLGAGIALFVAARLRQSWAHKLISQSLIVRGLILILLEQLLDNPPWIIGELNADIPIEDYRTETLPHPESAVWLHFGVLFELGAGLIIWGILLQLGTPLVLMLSVATILASYVLTINADPQVSAPAWRLLFVPGNAGIIGTGWPILPWVAISGFGLAFGRLLLDDETRAMRLALTFGIALILLFVCLRAIGLGDPHPLLGTGWIDFLRVTKYPPSPAFIALTVGGNLLLLCGFHRAIAVGIKVELFLTFGQAALFFYIVHTWMYMLVGLAFPRGVGFFWIYPIWLLGLVALYPLCRRYSDFKWSKPVESLWRMG